VNAGRRANAIRQDSLKPSEKMMPETDKTDTTESIATKIASARAGGAPAPIVWGRGVCTLPQHCGRCPVLCTRAIQITLESSGAVMEPWRDRRFGLRQARA
jgi:hypothetical protein